MMSSERFLLLLDKYSVDSLTLEERGELLNAIAAGDNDSLIQQHIGQKLQDDELPGSDLNPRRSAEILQKIFTSEKQNLVLLPAVSRKRGALRWIAAASIILLISATLWLLRPTPGSPGMPPSLTSVRLSLENSATQTKVIHLEDGTVVTLQPGASLHYPDHFAADKREVYLDGEAFFEVTKNPKRPFYVYNKHIVTHVLGTSFSVRNNPENGQAEVSVASGRVEVYENNISRSAPQSKNAGVILLPNQKAVFNIKSGEFIASLVDHPVPLPVSGTAKPEESAAQFTDAPLRSVLPLLEKNYGVEIVVENEEIYNCLFTGDITQQDLYERMNIVCEATGATYEIKGTRILVKGKGCN